MTGGAKGHAILGSMLPGMTVERTVTRWLGVLAAIAAAGATGCCDADSQCEPALSEERTPVASANLPAAWARASSGTVQLVVTSAPYRASDAAVERLRTTLREQAGLEVRVLDGSDTDLRVSVVLDYQEVLAAGRRQIPDGDGAAAVVVVVESTTYPGATFGFMVDDLAARPTAVIGLHRGPIAAAAVGPVSSEDIEAAVLLHEVGRWLGVPARSYHISAIDGVHCTNARCVVFKGSRAGLCAVVANLCAGVPTRFCRDCAEELAELRRRCEVQR